MKLAVTGFVFQVIEEDGVLNAANPSIFVKVCFVWHFAVWHHVIRNVGIEFARYCMNLWCPKLDVTNLMFHTFLA